MTFVTSVLWVLWGIMEWNGIMSVLVGKLLFLVSYSLIAEAITLRNIWVTSFSGNFKSVIGKVSHLEVRTNGILYDTEVQVFISNFGISGQEDDIPFVQWSTVMHTFVFSLSPFRGLCHQEIQSGSLKNV